MWSLCQKLYLVSPLPLPASPHTVILTDHIRHRPTILEPDINDVKIGQKFISFNYYKLVRYDDIRVKIHPGTSLLPLESVGIRENQSSKSFLGCHLFNYFHTPLIWSKKMSSYITLHITSPRN